MRRTRWTLISISVVAFGVATLGTVCVPGWSLCTGLYADPAITVDYGFHRHAREGNPMSVVVTLFGDDVDRVLDVRILGTPTIREAVELPRSTRKRLFYYTEPGTRATLSGVPEIEIYDSGRELYSAQLIARLVSDNLVPIVGAGPSWGYKRLSMPVVPAESLPTRPRGYEALLGLVVYPTAWSQIPSAALDSLVLWVARGGTLILPTLRGGARLRLAEDHPFGPLTVGEPMPMRGVCAEMDYATDSSRTKSKVTQFEKWDQVTLTDPPAETRRFFPREAQSPVVVGFQKFGRGRVYLLCCDPFGLPPEELWQYRDRFFDHVFFSTTAPMFRSSPASSRTTSRAAVRRRNPAVATSIWFLLFLTVYLCLIVPGDYFLVRRLNRPRLTWVTFPVTVLVFTGMAWFLGQGRVGGIEYREVTWIDTPRADPTMGIVQSVVGVYSDTNRELSFSPVAERAEVKVATSGGGPVTYRPEPGVERLSQKMHIFADHEYHVTWRDRAPLVTATLREDLDSGIEDDEIINLLVEGEVNRQPYGWVLQWEGHFYQFEHSEATVVDEGWEFSLIRGRPSKRDFTRDGYGHDIVMQMVCEDAQSFYSDVDGAWVAVLMPAAWPALEVRERNPTPHGLTIARCGVAVPKRSADEEVDRSQDIDPTLDEEG